MDETLSEHGLSHGEWSVLGSLYRGGPPHQRSAEGSTGAQAHKEALIAGALTKREREQLNGLLRRLMLEFERREGETPKKV